MNFHKRIETKQMVFDMFAATRRDYLDLARQAAALICRDKGFVTSDDVRAVVPLPKGIDGRVLGAVFSGKEWVKIGYTQTKVRSSHYRPISIFQLA